MDLSKFDGKHVRVTDKWGETFTGMAEYGNYDFLECEYGGEEDGIFIEDCLIYNSQIVSIEEIEVHGTAELWTEQLTLRRYRPEDAEPLSRRLGTDPAMYQYSGWNPYATPEMAQETVCRFINIHYPRIGMLVIITVDKSAHGFLRHLQSRVRIPAGIFIHSRIRPQIPMQVICILRAVPAQSQLFCP